MIDYPPARRMAMTLNAVATNAALAVVYGLTGIATLSFGDTLGPDLSSVLWIGSGIALAVALLVPFRVWPGVAVGAFLTTLWDGSPLTHVVATSAANAGEIALATKLLGAAGFNRRFGTVRDVLLLVGLACGVAAALGALVSVASLVATGGIPDASFRRIWLMWWLTHGMGMLLVVPITLILRARGREVTRATWGYSALILPVIAIGGWMSFLAPPNSLLAEIFFLPFPLLLFAAVRGDAVVAMLGGLIITLLAIAGALALRGPFSMGTSNDALLLTWSFVSVTIIATVIATAVVRERALAQREVESGERRLRAVLEATSEGILVADELGRVTDVNSAFLRLAGSTDDEILRYAGVDSLLDRLRPSRNVSDDDELRVLDPDLEADQRVAAEFELDDGRVVEAESVPLLGARSDSGRVWSMRDVTQRIASEEERRRLHEQILHSQKLEGLGVLAGGIAHDFNNVLAGIMGYTELLLAQPSLSEEGRSDAEGIIRAANHAAGLCGQLLTYAGKTTAVLAPVDLSECARDMRHFMALSVSKSVRLDLDLPDEPVHALADEVQIRQVLLNLVTNASEAVLEGPGAGSVLVRVRPRHCDREWLDRGYASEGLLPEGHYVVIEVEDDGVGMDDEVLGQIFDPFYSSKGTGRGLGLSAVLGVLRSHAGALIVETEAGLGTRFQVAIPRSEPSAAIVERAPPRRDQAGARSTVLVVDDEPIVRETLRRMIGRDGHDVIEAADGDHALEILGVREGDVDVIVMDLTMPHLDGLSTLAAMRDLGYNIPVILASGYSGEAVPPDASIAGFIQKPFRAAHIREMIAGVLKETRKAAL